MANLNFQQPPRSIAVGSLVARGVGAFGASSLSGHVTPTSGIFQPGSSFGQAQPPQLSPSRNVGLVGHQSASGRTSLFGPRAFADRRSIPTVGNANPMSSMGSFMAGSRGGVGSGSGFHSVFGGAAGDASTPPLLDLSEFPSLGRSGQGDQVHQPATAGVKPYVGMVKQPTNEQSEFQMSSEDFPALPGTQSRESIVTGSSGTSGGIDKLTNTNSNTDLPQQINASTTGSGHANNSDKGLAKRGIQTSPNGKVRNIPSSMVNNQFGMVGLLTFIRAAETEDPNLVSLALGQDLTALGLNLNSPDNLYTNFDGPWAETPCRPQDIDYHVPPEYLINMTIRDKLAPLKLTRYKEDLLFYMFYSNLGDLLQLAAATELYNREWRYHMEEKVWITQAPGVGIIEKFSTYERGTYYYFDAQSWRKVPKEFHLDYNKLEGRPHMPTN
ncbi:CCR4-NOT transcription complex subunit 2 isoform X2 [Ctenocephalides felis]|uniref:CCR4-NOT transcription complex subunit 2 isoform X2 n=1 Tax=Ctenocephalides felis TaxID=7515 RepID=UPI000E6E2185|nr:CCR4-NOT transcription complex subunit 2 isoform X2 [Ctenocephalides felis]